ncbi:MAG: DUF5320 domain-containing protein [Bacillota bacterium]|nr:DUF5320 domain-containing protein [Bacillota bacterium]
MTKGRNLYGPGFWKQSREWAPGSGGFRGGFCQYAGPGVLEPEPRWWGPCHFYPNYGLDHPWMDEAPPEDEALFLKDQVRLIRVELEEIEKRLSKLGKEQESE